MKLLVLLILYEKLSTRELILKVIITSWALISFITVVSIR